MTDKSTGRTSVITLDYSEYTANDFKLPASKDAWRTNWITKYVLKNVPEDVVDIVQSSHSGMNLTIKKIK